MTTYHDKLGSGALLVSDIDVRERRRKKRKGRIELRMGGKVQMSWKVKEGDKVTILIERTKRRETTFEVCGDDD